MELQFSSNDLTDKQVKKEFKAVISQNPDDYYPTSKLKEIGFVRNKCTECGLYFWHVDKDRTVCGDPACSGGFDLADGTPAKNKLEYVEVWNKIKSRFQNNEYKVVNRYPVTARWNPTTEFTMASIAAFQPHVVSGEVDAPAKKLVIPQFCLRFGDVDNVGVTGSHFTGFVMVGQHAFMNQEEWSQVQLFTDIYDFLVEDVGLDITELTIHEDAWAGGGNFGPCMEFFSRGVELFNQVYMMYEQTPKGPKPLSKKILDMGLGLERLAWFSQGTENAYEAVYGKILDVVRDQTKVEIDHALYKQFSKYSAYLNADEVEDLNVAWQNVADKMEVKLSVLKEKIYPNVALYSVVEHSRALLFALTDGALPSNTGGGYNLRIILRRALAFIDEFEWNIDLFDIMKLHAEDLKEIYPELNKNIDHIKKIMDSEKEKFDNSKTKIAGIVEKLIQKDNITEEDFIKLYDSNGISPEMIVNAAKKSENPKTLKAPDNFYAKVAELHEKEEQVVQTKKELHIELGDTPDTKVLYYNDCNTTDFKAKVVGVFDNKYVALDETYFYPTSGGQMHDNGTITNEQGVEEKVFDVTKKGKVILLVVPNTTLKVGDDVSCSIDKTTRDILKKHHSATHIINAAARTVLGPHINQAGAKKTIKKAQIDLTHYKKIEESELKEIEKLANDLIKQDIVVRKEFMTRRDAEDKFGMGLYQGGAVPGNELRIVDICGVDTQACGGTHVDKTREVGLIKILKSSKISDSVVRLEYVADTLAKELDKGNDDIVADLVTELGGNDKNIPSRCEELFTKWKKVKKLSKKGGDIPEEMFDLLSTEEFNGDILSEAAKVLKTQAEHLVKTVKRFKEDINKNNNK